jgi:hypothetical protein
MAKTNDLEVRLHDWSLAYGGGRYVSASGGGSAMSSIMRWHGRPPSGLGCDEETPSADEVEAAVDALLRQEGGYGPANVLRCEYLLPGQPREAKLQKLQHIGLRMDTTRYSQQLRLAKVHVAGWLRIPFSDPLTDEQAISMLEFIAGY